MDWTHGSLALVPDCNSSGEIRHLQNATTLDDGHEAALLEPALETSDLQLWKLQEK